MLINKDKLLDKLNQIYYNLTIDIWSDCSIYEILIERRLLRLIIEYIENYKED